MRVLFAMPQRPHGHDYLLDFIYAGFKELLGADNVVDVPQASWLHLGSVSERDACFLDCDQYWPAHGYSFGQAAEELSEGKFDLVVGSTVSSSTLSDLAGANGSRTPVALLDGVDCARNDNSLVGVTGGPTRYFKRELPIGADWALPLPMTYPSSRIRLVTAARTPLVVYHTASYPGSPRDRIVKSLQGKPWADVSLTAGGRQERQTPEDLHDRAAKGLIGVHWNTTQDLPIEHARQSGWDANRFWENCAMGLVNIAQRPYIQFPPGTEFVDGVNVLWVDNPEQVVDVAESLVRDPDRCLAMAQASQAWFVEHHAANKRAAYIIKQMGLAR